MGYASVCAGAARMSVITARYKTQLLRGTTAHRRPPLTDLPIVLAAAVSRPSPGRLPAALSTAMSTAMRYQESCGAAQKRKHATTKQTTGSRNAGLDLRAIAMHDHH
ncbi:hypothetical protein P280DRAFT_522050 [Massarina eburnea CBS 473.64]|uniref:Uncharacterized protein n=1 Tax=Massarina eburnea CBS 473.64 TaxID=1395130 RepID=A0A6A6RPN0_9PLEO|nr:hypothetical protein P280DRAFT_522050 [Massarina eburnea CBS 473.64]